MEAKLKPPQPQPKEVVTSLMKKLPDVTKQVPVPGNKEGKTMSAVFHVFECPRCERPCEAQTRKGFTNPYTHLKQCLGGETKLMEQYESAKAAQKAQGGRLADFFDVKSTSEREKAAYAWIKIHRHEESASLVCGRRSGQGVFEVRQITDFA
jgi:hypothetical protein